MTNKEMAERTRQAIAEFGRLPPDEQVRRLVAAGSINKHGETLMDPPLYYLCVAAVAVGYALKGLPNPTDVSTNGTAKQPNRAAALDELRAAFCNLEKKLRIMGDTPVDRIKSLGYLGGPAWRRRVIAKIIKAQSLEKEGKDSEALTWFGQAAWEYRDALPGNTVLEREIEKLWPTPPADDKSLDQWVC
jgi:hypothetical protein